jgi:hypothetical protein
MRWSRRIATFGVASALAVPAALATAQPAAITPSSIAGAKLGLGKVAYLRLLGRPVRFEAAGGGKLSDPGFQQPEDYARLVFAKRKMDVYFQGGVDRAIEATTWNRAYRTAEGVGPCSTFEQLRKAYGRRLKPNPLDSPGQVFSYTVGRSLLFVFNLDGGVSTFVTQVALYDGSAPGWNKPNGALPFAAFTAGVDQNDQACRR